MAPPANAKKGSRITIACNTCRSRKQKCSGEKPICMQCHEHNRSCDWPEQLKRGPAKGYIELVENRLHETETALLKVLSQTSDAQLAATFSPEGTDNSRQSYTPFSRLGEKGVDYWKRFPLDTARSIREWQHDCWSQDKTETTSTPANVQFRTGPSCEMSTAHSDASPPLLLQPNADLGKRKRGAELPPSQPNSPSQPPPTDTSQHTSQQPSSWSGAPSIKFQEQFLW